MDENELDDTVIYYGEPIKAFGDGRVGGYLVRFSSDADPDIVGEFFTADTDLGDASKSPVYYQHGQDPVLKTRKLGQADLKRDKFGVWAEAQLSVRDQYEKFIYQMVEDGKIGWSSGTAGHLVEHEQQGKAVWLKAWPLGLDASLTPNPAEYRNTAVPLKSINFEPLMEPPTDETQTQDGIEPEATKQTKSILEEPKMEITQEQIDVMVNDAVKNAMAAQAPPEPKPEPVDVAKAVADGVEMAMKKLPGTMTNVQVVTDEADQPFDNPGEFFQAVKNAAFYPANQDVRLLPLKATGLSENVPADGGYLLAPQLSGGIIEKMHAGAQILPRVASDQIGPNSNSMLYNAVDESSRADGSRWGGVLGYWMAEAGTLTASKPTFRQMELKLKKVAALCYATDELLADSTALESWLSRTVPMELRFQTEAAIVRGNGVGKPLGIMNSPALVSVTRIDASQIDATDIANMWARRWAGVDDYVWLANPSIFPQLINLTLGNAPFLLPANAPGTGNPSFSLYGKPYIESEYTYALGTSGDLILASLGQYQTINKGGVQAASSIHVQFVTDETAFRFIYRIDGQPLWNSAMTPYDAGSTLSPFVVLTAASS